MKQRFLAALLAAVLLLALGACSGQEAPPVSSDPPPSSESQGEGEQEAALGILSQFTATDLAGNEVTQSIFEDHPVTMVNVWATFCGPCLGEMPELGELHKEYEDQGFQIVGIVTDTLTWDGAISQSHVELAQEIVEETGAEYTHLLPSDDLTACLPWQINSVPTTIFVDETGALIGKGYLGARDKKAWKEIIEEKLAEAAGEEAAS